MTPKNERPGPARPSVEVRSHCPRSAEHHVRTSHDALVRRLASYLGLDYKGPFEKVPAAMPDWYLAPRETLCGENWRPPSIAHFFRGWTRDPLLATKAVVHPALPNARRLPPAWPSGFGALVRDLTLRGVTVFDANDAVLAGRNLLGLSRVIRLKLAAAEGGQDQHIVNSPSELEGVLNDISPSTLATGLVIEENLARVTTLSVGQINMPDQVISYVGRQTNTKDNHGNDAYGGSCLLVIRGGLAQLLEQSLPAAAREAIGKAAEFDRRAQADLDEVMASRRNYDIAIGITHHGRSRCGLLEQSWRIGGASGAEILALEVLASRPEANAVRASTTERYGYDQRDPSPLDFVIYHDEDPRVGPLLKTAKVEAIIGD
ncbi:Protein of unknown function [Paracoccus alcaliphilus]|uniref:DUF3182 family protein n=1 Tax=Paracoccus alcaliphilus TaxID=34002 RepID=A0A1H8NR23_9RHOB|nr:DUF3182 family protein [Paracoccus alcaliphilus]WCR18712.1 DUF3182 family protein [Paracoccus alcaliphilus]SEO32066.1 Protein of unknown function [Paracoccus alcaliphilus]